MNSKLLLFPTIPTKTNIFGEKILGFTEPKIILPEMYNDSLTRTEIIDRFLKTGWVPKKDEENIKKWFAKMLDEFSLELLLHAKHGGIDRLLTNTKIESRQRNRFETIYKVKPKKPRVYKIEVEEIEGELDSQAKTIKLQDIPNASYDDCY